MGEQCKQLLDLLSDYVDGDLESQLKEDIDSHLADCPPCHEFLAVFAKTVECMRELRMKEMPCEMRERLHSFVISRISKT